MNEQKIVEDKNKEWKDSHNWDQLSVPERISLLESESIFDIDIWDDPPAPELLPNQIDYIQEKWTTRFKSKIANWASIIGINHFIRQGQFAIKEIKGIENWQNLNGGAIITCNHFSPNDTFVMQKTFRASKQKKLFRVIREGNYTNPPMLKFFMRNCDVLPLSSNSQTMRKFLKAIDTILGRGEHILIYPEQAMWPDYKKPRPLKNSAYKFAVKNNVPVLPIFISIEQGTNKKSNPMPLYTVHILSPIYPDATLDKKDRIQDMLNKNYSMWVDLYEKIYGEKLVYNTK